MVNVSKNPPLDDEPNFDDPEGYVDDITDEELLGDILKLKPTEKPSKMAEKKFIVVDGIPQVNPDRMAKLDNLLKKLFSTFGPIVTAHYPKNEEDVTKGFMFLEYSTPEEAQAAIKEMNNYKLDKAHTFLVNSFTDFDKHENMSKEWNPPEPIPYENHGGLYNYLLNPDGSDQFCVTIGHGSNVQIWQNTLPDPIEIANRNNWTKTYVQFSPLGTFLCTFHDQGVVIRGGSNFNQYRKFLHSNPLFLDFSPCENYIVTYSLEKKPGQLENLKAIVWSVKTGLEKRVFYCEGAKLRQGKALSWSYDDKYFAVFSKDLLSVYETSTFYLLNKKSIKILGLRDFSWSPSSNIIAYWVAEDKDVPARVSLLEIPNRTELRNKNILSVANCKLYWQKSGDYLCAKVERYSKMRKEKEEIKYFGLYYNFEIFHMREKEIPVDNVDVKEPVKAFNWEPRNSKFSIIYGEGPNVNVGFYGVRVGQSPSLLNVFQKRSCSHMFWSPNGQFIVLAGLGSSGSLEFIDTNDFNILNSAEHYQVSNVDWDPSGRYVVTSVSMWKTKIDLGYWIWTFQGRILKRVNLSSFAQFLWRPRHPSLLSEEQVMNIQNNLKKYYMQFESKDRLSKTRASTEVIEKRVALMQKFVSYRNERLQDWNEQKTRRLELRNGTDTDNLGKDSESFNEVVELFVNEEIVVIEE